jgi:hypothetical protein
VSRWFSHQSTGGSRSIRSFGLRSKGEAMAMQARISTIEGDASEIDAAVKIINEKILPALTDLEGFTAANFLADRSAGKLVAVAFYQDEAALERSAEAVKPMRTEVAEAMNGKVVGVESYELVAQSW